MDHALQFNPVDDSSLPAPGAQPWFGEEPAGGLLAGRSHLAMLADQVEPLQRRRVLILGGGSAELAGLVLRRGAESVAALDLLPALDAESRAGELQPWSTTDALGRALGQLRTLPDQSLDAAVGVCPFSRLSVAGMGAVLTELRRVLCAGAPLAWLSPHPAAVFLRGAGEAPVALDVGHHGWFSARDRAVIGRLWLHDDEMLRLHYQHKGFADYIAALREGGYQDMPRIEELGIEPEWVEAEPELFASVVGQPLHLLIRVQSPSGGARPHDSGLRLV